MRRSPKAVLMNVRLQAAQDGALTIDARGLRCPAPVIRLARAAADAPPGSELTVLATEATERLSARA